MAALRSSECHKITAARVGPCFSRMQHYKTTISSPSVGSFSKSKLDYLKISNAPMPRKKRLKKTFRAIASDYEEELRFLRSFEQDLSYF